MKTSETELLADLVHRRSINALYRADVFCRKSERNAKIVVKKLQLRRAKKAFGVDYMTLLEKEATSEDFERCLRSGYEKIGVIHKEIRTLRAEKASLDDILKQKLAQTYASDEFGEAEVESPFNQKNDSNKDGGDQKGDTPPTFVVFNDQVEQMNHHHKETVEKTAEDEFVVLGKNDERDNH